VSNCYAEWLYRIGAVSSNATTNNPILFNSCSFNFGKNSGEYAPKYLLISTSALPISFTNCELNDTNGQFFVFGSSYVSVDNCQIRNGPIFDTTTIGGKVAKTVSLGFWDFIYLSRRRINVSVVRNASLYKFDGTELTTDTLRTFDCRLMDVSDFNNIPIPYWTQRIGSFGYGVALEHAYALITGAITNIEQSGREWSCRVATGFSHAGIVTVGSIVESAAGQLYYVKSATFTASYYDAVLVQLTEVRLDDSVWSVKPGSELTSGSMFYWNASRFYPCTVPVYAETTSGSSDIVLRTLGGNVASATSVGTLASGDSWDGGANYGRAGGSLMATVIDAVISTVTSGTGTLGMSANARFSGMFEYPIFKKGSY
jgi:hypothetical protein